MKRILTTIVLAVSLIFLQMLPGALSSRALAEPGSVAGEAPFSVQRDARQLLSGVPALFVENRGQTDSQVAYYVQASDKTVYFADDGVTIVLSTTRPESTQAGEQSGREPLASRLARESGLAASETWTLKLDFVGSSRVSPVGLERNEAVISYFTGSQEQWVTGLPTYSSIVYPNLWPGIDLVFRGEKGALKYEFEVAAGADPSLIQLAFRGAEGLRIADGGQLEIATGLGVVTDEAPVAWQGEGAERGLVEVAYVLGEAGRPQGTGTPGTVSFGLGAYDVSRPLVIDPAILLYCGYIGGSGADEIRGIAVDASGNAYVAGYAGSTEVTFPVTLGPGLTQRGNSDAFVAKVKADGTGLVYCGYIGGAGSDEIRGIAVDASGSAYVAGNTASIPAVFPIRVGPALTYGGNTDAFVAKVKADGTGLDYCGYIGGSDPDYAGAISVDASGNAYVAGLTASTVALGFPANVGPDQTHNGSYDAFVAKVKADGSGLDYCGYIGGDGYDAANAIAVDAFGSAYVAGVTYTTNGSFPQVGGPDKTHNGGGADGFVAKVKADGSVLVYCGYIGGSGDDGAAGIAVDASGSAYVAGYTGSTETTFPVTVGPDLTHNGGYDAFVAKVKADGTGLVYCGCIGGSDPDYASAISVDASGNAYVAGLTTSTVALGFPANVGPDLTHNGGYDAFVAKVKADGSGLDYCGYIGGTGGDYGNAIAVDASGNAYVAGTTQSKETTGKFPVTVGPDVTHNGGDDAFVAKVEAYPLAIASVAISGPRSGAVGAGYSFAASVSPVGSVGPVTYAWSPAPDAGQATAVATYSWGTIGSKVIRVTVSNPLGSATAETAIEISVPVSGGVISGPIAGVVGASYAFTATVSPTDATSPISYVWSPEPDAGQGTANVSYSWGTGGRKWVKVTVSNALGYVAGEKCVDIFVPVAGAAVSGPTWGAIGASHVFTAAVSPGDATRPILYVWSPVPDRGQGTTVATYSWATSGGKVVSVTASNPAGSVVGSATIDILPLVWRVFLPELTSMRP